MCEKLIPLFCKECGRILGARFSDDNYNNFSTNFFCHHCLTDIAQMADTIAVVTEQDKGVYAEPTGLLNVFSLADVDNLFGKYLIGLKPTDPLTILHWCHEQREKFTQEKVDKLSKRS